MTIGSTARRSKLDNAIIASLAAMAAMNVFVLTQQVQPDTVLAAVQTSHTRTV